MTARDRSHRPVSARSIPARPDSSPGVRKQRFSREEGSPRIAANASSSVGGRALDSWDGDEQPAEPSSTFITDVPTPVHRPEPTIVLQDPRLSLNRHHVVTDHVTLTLDQRCKRAQDRFRPAPKLKPEKASDEGSSSHLPSVDGEEKSRGQRERAKAALKATLAMQAEEYVALAFDAGSFSLFEFDDDSEDGPAAKMLRAAAKYDDRHLEQAKAARHHLVKLEVCPGDGEQNRFFNRRVLDLRRNRYFLYESLTFDKGIRGKRRKKKWHLETSCWAPRKESGNSGDFFETSDAMRRMFNVDWTVASKAHNLSWFIVKSQRDPSEWKTIDRSAAFAEVKEVKEALWTHYKLIYGAYDYYSMLYTDDGGGPEEPDLFNITFAAYMNFCEHNGMVTKKVPAGEFEVIWSIVNARDKALNEQEDKHNKDKALNRQEFLQCLVRCAVAVYVSRGTIGDVSDAVGRLMSDNLTRNMSKRCPSALQSSNAFRTRFCYIEHTSLVLEANIKSIHFLYENYAKVDQSQTNSLRDDDMMSIGEWLAFIKQMGLIESKQLTTTQAKNIFLWSRIRSVGSNSDKDEIRLRHMFFEDFLEALVRMATMMAFPTMIEIDDVNARNAGEFLMSMQVDDPEAYKEFLDTHRPRHQDVDGSDWDAEGTGLKGLFQPIWITIQHLIHLLIWTVEFNTSARRNEKAADGAIQEEEAAAFIRKRSQGDALHRTNTIQGADWRLAQDKAVFTAAAIKIQLASRAKKAKKKVEERRLKALQVQEVLEGEDDELAEKVETEGYAPVAAEDADAARSPVLR